MRLLFLVDHISDHFPSALAWLRLKFPIPKINALLEANLPRTQHSESLLLRNYATFMASQLARKEAANELEVIVNRVELMAILGRNQVNVILKKLEGIFATLQQRIFSLLLRLHSGSLFYFRKQLAETEGLADKTFCKLFECYSTFMQQTKHLDLFLHVEKLVLPLELSRALQLRYEGINPSFSVVVGDSNESTTPVSDAGTLSLESLL